MAAKFSIEAEWLEFEQKVLPKDVSQIQRDEMRLAFWAGAACLFNGLMSAFDAGAEPTADDLKVMDELEREIQTYATTLIVRAKKP